MLATPGPQPSGPEWVHEVKLDGIRLICRAQETGIRLTSRTGRDLTSAFPELVDAELPDGTVLDGELVADGSGRVPTVQHIARRIHRIRPDGDIIASAPVRYVVFDAVVVADRDLAPLPLVERREALTQVLPGHPRWTLTDWFDDGEALWSATREQGFEGVVAKRRDSRYRPGVRSPDWIKTAHRTTTDAVVVGWRPEGGARTRIGALVLAEPDGDRWVPVGSVGSGMTQLVSDALAGVLPDLARPTAPPGWEPEPRTRWVEPVLVVAVRHLGRTEDGRLRHPVLVSLRPDLTAADLMQED